MFRILFASLFAALFLLGYQNCGPASEDTGVDSLSAEELEIQSKSLKSQVELTCEQALDCRATGFGQKACGGPQEALVYSTFGMSSDDEEQFLAEVADFNENMDVYNTVHAISSDCAYVIVPEQFTCVNQVCQAN